MTSNPTSTHWHKIILIVCMTLQAALTLCYAITLHYELKTSGHDIISFAQPVFNFLHGNGFTSSVNYPYVPQYWLGYHFSPILYLVIPFYYFFPHVETFLTIGSVFVALAAWPIYLTARAILGNSFQALFIALLYLFNPFVVNGALWNFHEVNFAPLCIAMMLWAVVHHKSTALMCLSLVLLCIKEHYGLSVAGFGLLWAWHWREYKFGLGLSAFGIAALCVVVLIIMPHFNPTGTLTMINASSEEDRYSWLTSMESIESHIYIFAETTFWYGVKLLLPFLFIPLAAFKWLLPAAGDIAVNSLAEANIMRSLQAYYNIAVIPIITIALCQCLKTYFRQKKAGDMVLAIVVATICFSNMHMALPFSALGNIWELSATQFDYTPDNRKAIEDINALIPADAPVSAQLNILPHLRLRYKMNIYPDVTIDSKSINHDSEYIVLHLSSPFQSSLYVISIPFKIEGGEFFELVESLLHDPKWGVVYSSGRWVVLKKDAGENPTQSASALNALSMLKKEYNDMKARAHSFSSL